MMASSLSSTPAAAAAIGSQSLRRSQIVAMAGQKKVNRYDPNWKKQWFGAGLFLEGSEEVAFDVVKTLEKKKVLSGLEKARLLSKAEELGLTLSSIEKSGLLSKAEDLGLLSLVDRLAGASPSVLASVALPLAVLAVVVVVTIPDDSRRWWRCRRFLPEHLESARLGCLPARLYSAGCRKPSRGLKPCEKYLREIENPSDKLSAAVFTFTPGKVI